MYNDDVTRALTAHLREQYSNDYPDDEIHSMFI